MLVLGTQNQHKAEEISALLGRYPFRRVPSDWKVEEGITSLMENAILKAKAALACCQKEEAALGEDTGLFVDALGGKPGVLSARYAGEGCAFEDNVKKLLSQMKTVQKESRRAAFRTVAALAFTNGKILISSGQLEGEIAETSAGLMGFGYDPIFYLHGAGKTLAEINLQEKNKISHRALALRALIPYLPR